jgi:diguanylate cyclase (GGDEF)-like protein
MAANDPNLRPHTDSTGAHASRQGRPPLGAQELEERLEEEIGRAERYGAGLSCLLVTLANARELAYEHGEEMPQRTLEYIAAALARELRRFDRLGRPRPQELAIVLPGADSPRGEIVARRVLERVRTIKIESQGTRRPLELSVGLAAWSADMSARALIARARAAAEHQNGDDPPRPAPGADEGPDHDDGGGEGEVGEGSPAPTGGAAAAPPRPPARPRAGEHGGRFGRAARS